MKKIKYWFIRNYYVLFYPNNIIKLKFDRYQELGQKMTSYNNEDIITYLGNNTVHIIFKNTYKNV